MSNLTAPTRAGFVRWLERFYNEDLYANTPSLVEYAARGFPKCAVWAPGRMVDQVEDMLAAWRKNDTSGQDKPTPYLPIMVAAMAKDFSPAPADFSRKVTDYVNVRIPGDPKQRVFKMRSVVAEVRTQLAIFAADEPTARSLATQLDAYAGGTVNRRFGPANKLGGLDERLPGVFEEPDVHAIPSPTEVSNLTVLTIDFTLRATVPMLRAPKGDELNDGKGTGTVDDPSGYLVVTGASGSTGPAPQYAFPDTWTEGDP